MQGIAQVLSALTAILPLKVVLGIAAALGVVGVPFWVESIRERQIRGLVRRMVRAEPDARPALGSEAVALAGATRKRLLTLVESAIQYDQRSVRDQGLDRLAQVAPADAARIRKRLAPPPPKWRDAMEALIRVEALYADGLSVAGDEALERALTLFPGDPDLTALADRRSSAAGP